MKIPDGLIDSHTHLVHEDFDADRPAVLERARSDGLGGFIVPATDVRTAEKSLNLASAESGVAVAVGIHPHDVAKAGEGDTKVIASMAGNTPVVAIGEIGLDYFYDFSPPGLQKRFFQEQLDLAADRDLPVIVHTRDSMDDAIAMVRTHVQKHPSWCTDDAGGRRGVFHCFTGSEEQARTLFALGFYVSFPGILTFKKSPVAELFRSLDMERVLVETDAPYMAPVPMRGRRNEPAYVVHTARKMAELTGRSFDQVVAVTRAHTMHLFRLE